MMTTLAADDFGWRLDFFFGLAGDEKVAFSLFNFPASHVIQGRCGNRLTRPQIETRMVPGTTHSTIHHQTFRQRPAIMCASRADCEEVVATSSDKDCFAKRMPQEHLAFR